MKKKDPAPASIYSAWYNREFLETKISEKKTELAKIKESGGLQGKDGWEERTRYRFAQRFDRLSSETKRAYQSSARHFGKYLGIPKSQATPSYVVGRLILLSYLEATTLVEDYVMWMQEEAGLAPATINLRLAALRWLTDAARRVGWVDWTLDVESVKGGKVRDTTGPSEAEFRRILRVVNSSSSHVATRTKAIVYMLAFMGLRISSVISLDMDNIDFENRKVKVRWKGKGEKREQYVWRSVGEMTFDVLEEWIDMRGNQPGPVFIRIKKTGPPKRITVRTVQRDIEEVGREAATRKKLTPHGFRHFFATNNLKEEKDTRKVMKATGHTNIKTIEFYDDADEEAARDVMSSMEDRWLESLDEFEEEDEDDIGKRKPESEPNDEEEEEGLTQDLSSIGVFSAQDLEDEADEDYARTSTGMKSVDWLFGGKDRNWGMVDGSIIMIGGKRGLGKSTIARQIGKNICVANEKDDVRVMVASAEETPKQIVKALKRLDAMHPNMLLTSKRSLNDMANAAETAGVKVLIVDSISTVTVDGIKKPPGSITQIKAAGRFLLEWCKGVDDGDGKEREGTGISLILISHVTADGDFSGPEQLSHDVDALFMFTASSHKSPIRYLSCEGKNRFGDSTREIQFEMTDVGLVEKSTDEAAEVSSYSVFDGEYDEIIQNYELDDDLDYSDSSRDPKPEKGKSLRKKKRHPPRRGS